MTTDFSLKNITLFSQLDEDAQNQVKKVLQSRSIQAGEILFNQGDVGDYLVIVQAGRVAIFSPVEGVEGGGKPIRIFHPGEVLGEMALIDHKPRSLSARAEEPSTVLILDGVNFLQLISQNAALSMSIMQGLSDRVRYTTDFLNEVRNWVRKMAEGDYQVGSYQSGKSGYQDQTLASLAADFAQMAAAVQKREEQLRQEVAKLRIEIDESKRKQEVEQITGSDFYQDLRAKIRKMRDEENEDE
jgi:CRP-like cAMP-binding protein